MAAGIHALALTATLLYRRPLCDDKINSLSGSQMHKFSWAAFGAQAVNLATLVMNYSSPHTAAIVGGALAIVQAVFPSVSKNVNAKAAEQAAAQ